MLKRALLILFVTSVVLGASYSAQEPRAIDFARDVQPIFKQSCVGCHGPAIHQNGFRLDRRSDAMRGGTATPGIIRPGNSEASLLMFRISGNAIGPQMPPTGALRPEQIATIKAWLDQGADWPDEFANDAPPVRLEPRAEQLMQVALWGTAASVKTLLEQGADPNVRNEAGATPLMWAVNDLEKARLLLDHHANVNATSDDGRTPLLIAAGVPGAAPVVALLIDRGATVNVKAPGLFGETTPLAEATYSGDEAVFRLLLDHGADVNAAGPAPLSLALRAACGPCVEALLKSTAPALVTPAMQIGAPPFAAALATNLLLDHGAAADAKDEQGRTMLMLAAASDDMLVDVVKTLLARGVDVNAKTPQGETALGHALLRGHTPIVDLLRKAGATEAPAPSAPAGTSVPAESPRAAIERAIPLLQKTDGVFLKKSGCVSCHNNTLTAMSVAAARGTGIRVDEEMAQQSLKTIATFIDGWRERAFQGVGIPGDADTVSYILLGMAAEKYPADRATDAMAFFLKRTQLPSGQWRIVAHRPPIESSDVEVTAASMRALQLYAPKARPEYQQAVRRAAAWLAQATLKTTEDRAFHLLALGWSRATKSVVQKAGQALVAEQRPDGGWAQLPTMNTDAYATGEALVALAESGVLKPGAAVYKRGVQFLLNSQFEDGSWRIQTRAIPLQPLFDIGFPHGANSWVSAAGTNWATMALVAAAR
jgi:ankyrin repeat protein